MLSDVQFQVHFVYRWKPALLKIIATDSSGDPLFKAAAEKDSFTFT